VLWNKQQKKTVKKCSTNPVFVEELHLDADVTAKSFKLVPVFSVSLLRILEFLCSRWVTDAWCRL